MLVTASRPGWPRAGVGVRVALAVALAAVETQPRAGQARHRVGQRRQPVADRRHAGLVRHRHRGAQRPLGGHQQRDGRPDVEARARPSGRRSTSCSASQPKAVSVSAMTCAAVEPADLRADPVALVLAELVGVVAVVEVRGDGQPALRGERARRGRGRRRSSRGPRAARRSRRGPGPSARRRSAAARCRPPGGRSRSGSRVIALAVRSRESRRTVNLADGAGHGGAGVTTVSRSRAPIRPDLDALPAYVPGRTIPGAIKLASNEVTLPPPPRGAGRDRRGRGGRQPLPRPGGHRPHRPARRGLRARPGPHRGRLRVGEPVPAAGVDHCATRRRGRLRVAVVRVLPDRDADPGRDASGPCRSTRESRHDLDAMAAAVTDRTRLVFVCSPNNPTGTAVRRDELERFLARSARTCWSRSTRPTASS